MLAAIGLNHHRTPISIRERFALRKQELQSALQNLKERGIGELAILSTCNRTEVYCKTENYSPITDWLADTGNITTSKLQSHLFIAPSREAVRHIYRVASGLDSMVVGEANIFGQIKEAVRIAQETNTLGVTLHKLFQSSFAVAKEVRNSTDIGRHGVSMATVAVQLSENIFENLGDTAIMFVGTGEMIELCATHYCARRPQKLMFVSKNINRANRLAKRFGGDYGVMGDIDNNLAQYDIIISCTDSALPIIGSGMVARAIKKRNFKPMMMVDLGVPRNIEPEAKEQNEIFLYSVDDLQDIINANLGERKKASQQAQIIVEARVDEFLRYLDKRKAVGVIKNLQQLSQFHSQNEINKALQKINKGVDSKEVLQEFSQKLSNKHLHPWLSLIHDVEGNKLDELLNLYQNALIKVRQKTSTKINN